MNLLPKSLALAVAIAAAAALTIGPAAAAPMPSAQTAPAQLSSEVELARGGYYHGGHGGFRGYGAYGGHRSYGHRRHYGRNIGIGIGAAIIGGVILSEAARAERRRVYSSDHERCAQTYRSFEPRTGMYTGYDGVRRVCPYLD